MKEIIPLKKDIVFKTTIGEITNINLDHNYEVKDNLIEGYVLLYGTYKMTEASVLEEEFSYKIPFGISISKSIIIDSINIEIDDFKYEVNKDVLKVSIDLEFTCDKEIEEPVIEDNSNQIESSINDKETNIEENITNITNTIINNDNKYYSYKVYIVRSGDSVESICNKYKVTLNDLKEYNNIDNIEVGDKVIIPYIND